MHSFKSCELLAKQVFGKNYGKNINQFYIQEDECNNGHCPESGEERSIMLYRVYTCRVAVITFQTTNEIYAYLDGLNDRNKYNLITYMKILTLNTIRSQSPCASGWRTLLKSLNKTTADDTQVSISHLLVSNGIQDTLWVIYNCLNSLPDFKYRHRNMVADFAESVVHLYQKEYPDDMRVQNCINMIRNIDATEEELSAAKAAARDAAWAAAGDAAGDVAAARAKAAAGDAAWAVAKAAAKANAADWAGAIAAAGDAAWVVARDVAAARAGAAASDAARAGAWAAEEEIQKAIILKRFPDEIINQ
jgi:hypothetical protein